MSRVANIVEIPKIMLLIFMMTLWIAGGGSRPDIWGQSIVRGVSGVILITLLLTGRRQMLPAKPLYWFLAIIILLPIAQLIPLPPALWQALPGRDFVTALGASVWRPVSLAPTSTMNALMSLIVPLATLALVVQLRRVDDLHPGLIFWLVLASALIGLAQFAGVAIENPLVNYGAGEVSGLFANRNHFALFVAVGCLAAPVWALSEGSVLQWRGPLALTALALFFLIILATGSRTGILLGVIGVGLGVLIVRRQLADLLAGYSRWAFPTLLLASALGLGTIAGISVDANRAVSITRVLNQDIDGDLRVKALPTIVAMTKRYFPAGSGFGGFDPVFRMNEPEALLTTTYLNRAHNDLLEVVLDGGAPALLTLVAALLWWGLASIAAWRAPLSRRTTRARLGSAVILLVLIASAVDYPARTPLIMAIIVIAAVWLHWHSAHDGLILNQQRTSRSGRGLRTTEATVGPPKKRAAVTGH